MVYVGYDSSYSFISWGLCWIAIITGGHHPAWISQFIGNEWGIALTMWADCPGVQEMVLCSKLLMVWFCIFSEPEDNDPGFPKYDFHILKGGFAQPTLHGPCSHLYSMIGRPVKGPVEGRPSCSLVASRWKPHCGPTFLIRSPQFQQTWLRSIIEILFRAQDSDCQYNLAFF